MSYPGAWVESIPRRASYQAGHSYHAYMQLWSRLGEVGSGRLLGLMFWGMDEDQAGDLRVPGLRLETLLLVSPLHMPPAPVITSECFRYRPLG